MLRPLVVLAVVLALEDGCSVTLKPAVPLMIIPVASPSPPEPPYVVQPPCTVPQRLGLPPRCLLV